MSAPQVLATAQSIVDIQRPDGMIPWFPGGHCDPWNHVEAAMALTTCGLDNEADRAYQWLVDTQLPDGSWFNYYVDDRNRRTPGSTRTCAPTWPREPGIVTSPRAISTGLEHLWPALEAGVDFVLRWRRLDGSIRWSLDPSGVPEEYALLTGSSSIYHSLRCAIACAERLGERTARLGARRRPARPRHGARPVGVRPKVEFAMDWYYPMLSGAMSGPAADERIDDSWETFVIEGLGVRCVSTGDWVTAAETAECVLTLDSVGMDEDALQLFTWAQSLRNADGSYWTGMVYPEEATYPPLERSTYTAGALVLAADALSRATPASGLFRGEGLPSHLDLTEPAPEAPVEPGARHPGHPRPRLSLEPLTGANEQPQVGCTHPLAPSVHIARIGCTDGQHEVSGRQRVWSHGKGRTKKNWGSPQTPTPQRPVWLRRSHGYPRTTDPTSKNCS